MKLNILNLFVLYLASSKIILALCMVHVITGAEVTNVSARLAMKVYTVLTSMSVQRKISFVMRTPIVQTQLAVSSVSATRAFTVLGSHVAGVSAMMLHAQGSKNVLRQPQQSASAWSDLKERIRHVPT